MMSNFQQVKTLSLNRLLNLPLCFFVEASLGEQASSKRR